MDTKFYIPEHQEIPTELRLIAEDKHVIYRRLQDAFGYDFEFFSGESVDEAMEIAKKLAEIMCAQSFDHGSEWRIVSVNPVQQCERFKIGETIRVLFRVRDSY